MTILHQFRDKAARYHDMEMKGIESQIETLLKALKQKLKQELARTTYSSA
jgi:hypothetical protein